MGQLVHLRHKKRRRKPDADSVTARRAAKVLLFTGVHYTRDRAEPKRKHAAGSRRQTR